MMRHLMESAAQGGDLTAQIEMQKFSLERIKAEQLEDFMSQVISTHDPDAMLPMSSLARRGADGALDLSYSMLAAGRISEAARAIAGCQTGADCGPGSLVMDSACLATGICGYSSYEIFVRQHMVPPGEVSRLNEYIEFIFNGP